MADPTLSAIAKLTQTLDAQNTDQRKAQAEALKTDREILDNLKTQLEEQGLEAKDNKKFQQAEAALKKAEFKFRKQNAVGRAAKKEIQREEREALGGYFERYLGKGSKLALGIQGVGESLKKKVVGGLDNLFGLIKKGAFLGFLLATVKFLQSEKFTELKDKYLPAVGDALQGFYDTMKGIVEDFFVTDPETGKTTFSGSAGLYGIFRRLRDGLLGFGKNFFVNIYEKFWDENGDLSIWAGLKEIGSSFVKLATVLGAGGILLAALAPGVFFGTAFVAGKLFGLTLGKRGLIAKSWGLLFGKQGLKGLMFNLDDTGKGFKTVLGNAKKTGVFRKGLGGLLGRFTGLFGFLGKKGLTGAIVGVLGGMAGLLGGQFRYLFQADNPKSIVYMFKSTFDLLVDFGDKIAGLATKGANLLLKVVGAADDAIVKAAAKAANLIPTKVPKPPKLSANAMAALSGTGKYSVDAIAGTAPKAAAAATELASKTLQKSILKRSVGFGAKAIPIVGMLAGGYFALEKLIKGDFVGAGMEGGGIFAPSLIGMPLDIAIMIRDIYNDVYKTPKRKFPFDGDLVTDPKGTNSRLMKIKKDLFTHLGLSGDGKPIPKVGEGDISNVDPALAAAAGLGLPKSNTATMAGGSGSGMSGGDANGGNIIVPQVIQQSVGGTSNSHHYGTSIKPDSFVDGLIRID